ncbi:MAG: hypothetical protein J5J06_18650 [Phycisphaerae bacterium]|nr:hypothetical protein [Phycisphaerae bacterium]
MSQPTFEEQLLEGIDRKAAQPESVHPQNLVEQHSMPLPHWHDQARRSRKAREWESDGLGVVRHDGEVHARALPPKRNAVNSATAPEQSTF